MNINIEQARINMISQQLRTCSVLDEDILELIRTTPREDFVPVDCRAEAFAECRIPLGKGETMLSPKDEAQMLQALALSETDRVLEIGTGSGYMTALLARSAKHVYSIDIHAEFTEAASKRLAQHQINNVSLITADAATGWEEKAPYDAIIITGSLPELPKSFCHSLTVGGRMVAIVGKSPAMECVLIERIAEDNWQQTALFDTDVNALQNARAELFTF